jgi:hypothetical protein
MPSFLNPDTGTFLPATPRQLPVVTGTTVNMWKGHNMLQAPATVAALTVMMPPGPRAGETVTITPTAAVTTLTMKDATNVAVAGAPAALVANTALRMLWTGAAWTKLSP